MTLWSRFCPVREQPRYQEQIRGREGRAQPLWERAAEERPGSGTVILGLPSPAHLRVTRKHVWGWAPWPRSALPQRWLRAPAGPCQALNLRPHLQGGHGDGATARGCTDGRRATRGALDRAVPKGCHLQATGRRGGGLWRWGTDQSAFIRGQACPLGKGGRGVRGRWMKIRRKWPHEPVVGPVTSQTQSSDRELGGFPSCFRHSSQCLGHMGAHSAPCLGCPCPTGQHAGELR